MCVFTHLSLFRQPTRNALHCTSRCVRSAQCRLSWQFKGYMRARREGTQGEAMTAIGNSIFECIHAYIHRHEHARSAILAIATAPSRSWTTCVVSTASRCFTCATGCACMPSRHMPLRQSMPLLLMGPVISQKVKRPRANREQSVRLTVVPW